MRSFKTEMKSFVDHEAYTGQNKAPGNTRSFTAALMAHDKHEKHEIQTVDTDTPIEETAHHRESSGSGFGKYDFIVSDLVLSLRI